MLVISNRSEPLRVFSVNILKVSFYCSKPSTLDTKTNFIDLYVWIFTKPHEVSMTYKIKVKIIVRWNHILCNDGESHQRNENIWRKDFQLN